MDGTTKPPSADKDRFVFWPLLLAVGLLFVGVLLGTYPEYGEHARAAQIGAILSELVLFFMGLFCSVAAVYLASFERTWRLAASMAVLPVAIVIAILYQDYVLAPIGAVVTYIYRLAGFDMEWPY
jgi:hypothetical protein